MNRLSHAGLLRASVKRETATQAKRVLYAEDNDLLRELIARGMRRAGYVVLPVADGRAAFEAAQGSAFDLLITDNDMPQMTGLELIARLRLKGSDMPIVVTSASTGHLARNEYGWLQLGAWLKKPFDLQDLIIAVRKLLGNGSPQPSAAYPWVGLSPESSKLQ